MYFHQLIQTSTINKLYGGSFWLYCHSQSPEIYKNNDDDDDDDDDDNKNNNNNSNKSHRLFLDVLLFYHYCKCNHSIYIISIIIYIN